MLINQNNEPVLALADESSSADQAWSDTNLTSYYIEVVILILVIIVLMATSVLTLQRMFSGRPPRRYERNLPASAPESVSQTYDQIVKRKSPCCDMHSILTFIFLLGS